MTDYEQIMAQCRKYYFSEWDEAELRRCIERLPMLTREELLTLYRSKWVGSKLISQEKRLKEAIFKTIFKDKVGLRDKRIKTEDTGALIEEFKDKHSGCVSLARRELRERYKAGRDRQLIAMAFNAATKNDQQWVKWQIRKERYANSSYKRI